MKGPTGVQQQVEVSVHSALKYDATAWPGAALPCLHLDAPC